MTAVPPERRHRQRAHKAADGTLGPGAYSRDYAVAWFRANRERSRRLFDMIEPEAYETRPIALRNPIVFYEGHQIVFSVNVLLRNALGQAPVDPEFETLFERGIDPESTEEVDEEMEWPAREQILAYAEEAERRIIDALEHAELDRPGDPHLENARAVWIILEHEAMHHETLMYMFHRLGFSKKRRQGTTALDFPADAPAPERSIIEIPEGPAVIGQTPGHFGWDNEFPQRVAQVAAFDCDSHPVTNADYRRFIESGGYEDARWWDDEAWRWKTDELIRAPLFWEKHNGEWYWRGMFELVPLPEAWPVWVSLSEAQAFARWAGRRIMTEEEYHRVAFTGRDGEQLMHPWGNEAPQHEHGNFDFQRWDPAPVDAHPAGASPWGVHDLVGNGWEWTSSPFRPSEGFQPDPNYPLYSTDFFDDRHFVLKGASPVTARELIRSSFRNWFRGNYPYVYAKFRTVASRG